jgi:hypothetical protein
MSDGQFASGPWLETIKCYKNKNKDIKQKIIKLNW